MAQHVLLDGRSVWWDAAEEWRYTRAYRLVRPGSLESHFIVIGRYHACHCMVDLSCYMGIPA